MIYKIQESGVEREHLAIWFEMHERKKNKRIVTFTVAGVATIEWIFLRQSDMQQHTPIKASHLFRGTLSRNRPLWYCGHDWHRSCNRIYGFRPCVSGKRHPRAMCKSWLNPLGTKQRNDNAIFTHDYFYRNRRKFYKYTIYVKMYFNVIIKIKLFIFKEDWNIFIIYHFV